MKKIVALLLSLFILAGCSTAEKTPVDQGAGSPVVVEISQVMADITSEKADKVELYVAAENGATAPLAIPEESVDQFAQVIKTIDDVLANAEFESIERTDIDETNVVFQLRNKETKANLYVYDDGNLKITYGINDGFYSVGVDTNNQLIEAMNSFTSTLSAE